MTKFIIDHESAKQYGFTDRNWILIANMTPASAVCRQTDGRQVKYREGLARVAP
jgi:hypothetical protein